MKRLVLPGGALGGDVVELSADLRHYVKDVLRMGEGDVVELCDGAGVRATARLTATTAVVLERRPPAARPRPSLSLFQGLGKGDKMDGIVRQTAELGAARLVPVRTRRTVPRGLGRGQRWRSIAEDALRVSLRPFRMIVEDPMDLSTAVDEGSAELMLIFDRRGDLRLDDVPSSPPADCSVWVGPEGGFTEEELSSLTDRGGRTVSLGSTNLRTETAGPAVVAALLLGRWGGLP